MVEVAVHRYRDLFAYKSPSDTPPPLFKSRYNMMILNKKRTADIYRYTMVIIDRKQLTMCALW